jgi:hypothetical protein
VEGVYVGPKERERRLAKQRVYRSHRRRNGRHRRRPPAWTKGEKATLVVCLSVFCAEEVLAVVMLLP